MTPTEREAIEKDAIKYVIQETGYQVLPEHEHWKNAYIAGATAEHDKARNQAIQDCIDILINDIKIPVKSSWLEKLKSLKNNQLTY